MTRPVVVRFEEARLMSDSRGTILTADRAVAGKSWRKSIPPEAVAMLAGRVASTPTHGRDALSEVEGNVLSIPDYVGFRGLLLRLPLVFLAIDRAVKRSTAVSVKVPGVIGAFAIVSAAMRRRRIAIDVVGDVADVVRSGALGNFARMASPFVVWSTKWTVSKGDAVHYVTRSALQERYPAASSAKVTSFSDVVIHEVRQKPSGMNVPRVVVAVGSQEQIYKGHHDLLKSLSVLLPTFPDVRLVLVGDGRQQPGLRDLASSLGVASSTDFMGAVATWQEVKTILDSSMIFAQPSLTEGMPRALVEAMSRGLPCVGSRVGGIPELLDDSVIFTPGKVRELSDRLAMLLSDGELRAAEGARNSKVAQTYSVSRLQEAQSEWQRTIRALIINDGDSYV